MILEKLAACLLMCRTRSSSRRRSRPQGRGMTERLVELGLRPELLRLQGELTGRPQQETVTNPWTSQTIKIKASSKYPRTTKKEAKSTSKLYPLRFEEDTLRS